jgi:SAM-dependent methyltransferase
MIIERLRSLWFRYWVLPRDRRKYKAMSVAETFSTIYRTKGWGSDGGQFCSGPGSWGPVADRYCAFIIDFIAKNQIGSVVDLGCGDFAIGKRIVDGSGVRYTGIDVVPELIEHHQKNSADSRVNFCCANIVSDDLPQADLYLIRQVLQHLSNDEVGQVLGNLSNCSKALISEHVPIHPKTINLDKPHGPDIRRFAGSGLYIDQPPFSIAVETIWDWELGDDSLLRTCLVDRSALKQVNVPDSQPAQRA